MNENQNYSHLFVYIATTSTIPYMTQKDYQCNASRIFSHSHLKLNANENVRGMQGKKLRGNNLNPL